MLKFGIVCAIILFIIVLGSVNSEQMDHNDYSYYESRSYVYAPEIEQEYNPLDWTYNSEY